MSLVQFWQPWFLRVARGSSMQHHVFTYLYRHMCNERGPWPHGSGSDMGWNEYNINPVWVAPPDASIWLPPIFAGIGFFMPNHMLRQCTAPHHNPQISYPSKMGGMNLSIYLSVDLLCIKVPIHQQFNEPCSFSISQSIHESFNQSSFLSGYVP